MADAHGQPRNLKSARSVVDQAQPEPTKENMARSMLTVGSKNSRPWWRVEESLAAVARITAQCQPPSSSCEASCGHAAPQVGKRDRIRNPRSGRTWMASRTMHRVCRGLGCGVRRLERRAAADREDWSPPCNGNRARSRPRPNLGHHCRLLHHPRPPSMVWKVCCRSLARSGTASEAL
jgi:hypothetical protein